MHPRLLLVALQLLTRLPVGDPWRAPRDIADSTAWYPVVGALVGGVAASAWWLADLALSPMVAATVATTGVVALTGALHEDGLADSADGLFGGADPDRRLAIMRDSTLGAYGVVAVVLVLLLRVGLIASLVPVQGAAALVVASVVGRGVLPVAMLGAAGAAAEGSGAGLVDALRPGTAIAAAVVTLLLAVGLLGLTGLGAVAAAAAVAVAVRLGAERRLGGVTGDVMGAVVVLGEVAALAVAAGTAPLST